MRCAGNEVTVRVVPSSRLMISLVCYAVFVAFPMGISWNSTSVAIKSHANLQRKSTARFFKAKVVSRSKRIYGASYSLWNVAGCRRCWSYDVIISYRRMLVIVVIRVGCLWFILLQLIPRYDYSSERAVALCHKDVNKIRNKSYYFFFLWEFLFYLWYWGHEFIQNILLYRILTFDRTSLKNYMSDL